MSAGVVYYHGGVPGLRHGDLVVPAPPHVEDGCPVCEARAAGRTYTIGEHRAWARKMGSTELMAALDDPSVPDSAVMDPPRAEQGRVYVTTHRQYATFYAARSGGDLYKVEPIGDLTPSEEDHFPTWTVESARVVIPIRRRVRLSSAERRHLMAAWKRADFRAMLRARSTPEGGQP